MSSDYWKPVKHAKPKRKKPITKEQVIANEIAEAISRRTLSDSRVAWHAMIATLSTVFTLLFVVPIIGGLLFLVFTLFAMLAASFSS